MTSPSGLSVGVVVERTRSANPWVDYLWRPTTLLPGAPETEPWTKLADDGERATFYLGQTDVILRPSESGAYRDNLAAGASLWVVLRPTEADPPYDLFAVTADPSEGEAMTEAGGNIVEPLPMPEAIRTEVAAFVAQHPDTHVFEKRKRDRADPEALARRGRLPSGGRR